ncbi:MAG TPA: bifunctional 4-hydroxy-3-methylbut-2-enyl diphosphate reductase/30S ribosomal protein S1 [Clostridiaceae bacterium]|nr:bifunctional 4-hydroxy-3-methylbut-2-enyl diphosphate reductase/30S ribosomal protein S1 [Clostridiaceae bacterium]
MEVVVAKTAGFCFGVNKAVNMIYDLLGETEEQIYTIGPIIHNEQVVNSLKDKGVQLIYEVESAEKPGYIFIRAHGVVPEIYKEIEEKDLKVIDATCPFVKRIHVLVSEKYKEGYKIFIVGDKNHPEVIGINGWCNNSAFVTDNPEDIKEFKANEEDKICVVAQTTIKYETWEQIIEILDRNYKNVEKFETICNATSKRQSEAAEIAANVDLMLVIGSRNSSNTKKLYEICKEKCSNTYMVQTSGELPPVNIKNIKKVGVTAGASTPDWIIKEVIQKMEELSKQSNDMDFKEAFESSLVTLRTGEIVKGKIIGFNNSEVYLDLGYKSDGIIQMDEFTDDPDFDPKKNLAIGDEVEAFVIRVNDGEGHVLLSKKKVDAIKSWEKIERAYENKQPVNAKVVEITKGGVLASVGGVRVFIPASQLSDRYVKDLNDYLKQTLDIKIIEFDKRKKKVVGSSRVLIEEEKERMEKEFWDNVEVGKTYSGTVKSLTDFGAFVDIGGVDGLIHISELSWYKIKHPSEVVNVGDKVEVYVLEFDKEKKKISLGYRKAEDDPWYNIDDKYQIGNIVKGKVVRLVPFGAFVELEKGVDALVHISQISTKRIAKPGDVLTIGQEVEAKVIEVNAVEKKINISIKEVNPIDPVEPEEENNAANGEKDAEEVPTEHVEEMSVTLGDLVGGLENSQGEKKDE